MPDRISLSLDSTFKFDQIRDLFETSDYNFSAKDIYRLAISFSINRTGSKVVESIDSTGREIRSLEQVLENKQLFKEICSISHSVTLDENEFEKCLKNHLDNGISIIHDAFKNKETLEDALIELFEDLPELSSKNESDGSSNALKTNLGKDLVEVKDIEICFNGFNNYSICIIGIPGTGKTQFLKKLITDLSYSSNYNTKFIIFDYKGDISENQKFIHHNNLISYTVDEDSGVPISPFILKNYTSKKISACAWRVSESIAAINPQIGEVQTNYLRNAIELAFAKRKTKGHDFPDFDDIYEQLTTLYEEDGKSPDTLLKIITKISDFNLLWEYSSSDKLIDDIHDHSCVIDFSKSPVDKQVMGFMILEAIYSEMQNLPDAPLDSEGIRKIRSVIVIDEAHNFLHFKNEALEKIIREGRSKGIAVFFASQSADDYKQKHFDYSELLQFKFLFGVNNISTSQTKAFIGCSESDKVLYQDKLHNLDKFQMIFIIKLVFFSFKF